MKMDYLIKLSHLIKSIKKCGFEVINKAYLEHLSTWNPYVAN